MKTFIMALLALGVVLGVGFWLFQSSKTTTEDPSKLPGQLLENQGQTHIEQGAFDHPAYNSNPPTSGWHWPQGAQWGVYPSPLPDEQLVHNLEHGGIWISYKPDLDKGTVNQLNDFAKRYRKVIVAPREGNDAPIALAAWTRLEKMDQYNEFNILTFIDAYYDKGPEKVD